MRWLAIILTVLVSGSIVQAASGTSGGDGVLRINTGAHGTLDPARASSYADRILMFNVYDTLILPAAGAPGHVPHLARSWARTEDGYSFVLRDDVRFHSGNRLTAHDVVYSLDRMRAIKGNLAYLFEPVDSAVALDIHTVSFKLKTPYAAFLQALLRLPIVDKVLLEQNLVAGATKAGDWGQGYLSRNAAGSGAYRIESRSPGADTVFTRNADYFLDVPKAAPERVEMSHGLSGREESDRFRTGALDITSQWLTPDALAALVKTAGRLLSEPGAGGFYFQMNTQKPPFDDPECRLAIANAFDYEAMLKLLKIDDDVALGRASTGAIPEGMLGALPPTAALKQNLTAAKNHLGSCRHAPADIELDIVWIEEAPLERDFAKILQESVGKLGLKTVLGAMSWDAFTSAAADPKTTPGISPVYEFSATGDVDALLYGMYHSDAGTGWQSASHLDDPQVDALLVRGRAAASQHDRASAYRDLNRRLLSLAPTIAAFDRISVFAASDRVDVPALSDPASRFEVPGMGLTFRLMTMVPDKESK